MKEYKIKVGEWNNYGRCIIGGYVTLENQSDSLRYLYKCALREVKMWQARDWEDVAMECYCNGLYVGTLVFPHPLAGWQ